MRILIATIGVALVATTAACGGGEPEEVPESRWTLEGIPGDKDYRDSDEEWVAKCQAGAFNAQTHISECTDDPVIAQRWAEVAEEHFGDGASCESQDAETCVRMESLGDGLVLTLPADQ